MLMSRLGRWRHCLGLCRWSSWSHLGLELSRLVPIPAGRHHLFYAFLKFSSSYHGWGQVKEIAVPPFIVGSFVMAGHAICGKQTNRWPPWVIDIDGICVWRWHVCSSAIVACANFGCIIDIIIIVVIIIIVFTIIDKLSLLRNKSYDIRTCIY